MCIEKIPKSGKPYDLIEAFGIDSKHIYEKVKSAYSTANWRIWKNKIKNKYNIIKIKITCKKKKK